MGSKEAKGKGNLPKWKETHSPKAGSDIEEMQDCHIGNYMEGYSFV
ncbi:hypothetical protein HNQ94_001079 [Salirhabdus euzebyi]|uniref:Uncharacterized protein n=1 Tax=Salirhabdus euzebyi TaxID=394506 RepID=A0A841Q239_9BACI|nr:hypothetical protein [Salirhabdus euzebyi]